MAVTVRDNPARDPEDRPWLRVLIGALVVIVLVGGGGIAAYKMGIYGGKRGEEKLYESATNGTAKVGIDFVNRPPWLSASVTDSRTNPDSLMNDVIAFMQETSTLTGTSRRPMTNYMRLLNPQDRDVLRELAGFLQNHTNLHGRAWIKAIRSIKREAIPATATAPEIQRIMIDAEYREPLAYVVQGDAYLLVERVTKTVTGQKQVIRLPGTYTLQQRRLRPEMPCVSGVDASTPEPGQAFTSDDAIAGLELAAVLRQQPYIKQIATINVSNFGGRREPDPRKLTPQIVLETVFPDPLVRGETTKIKWGRPVGEEKFFEVSASAKLRYLTNMFMRYNRIDAGEEYVDVRGDQPIVPMARGRSDAGGAGMVVAADRG